jgi:hypothetical protein
MTNLRYAKQGLWKLGKAKNGARKRLSSANTSHPKGDDLSIVFEIKTHDALALENRCKYIFQNMRPTTEREWIFGPFEETVKLIQFIADNMDKETEEVNDLVQAIHSAGIKKDADWLTRGLDMSIFKKTIKNTAKKTKRKKKQLTLTLSDETKEAHVVINVSDLTPDEMKEKLTEALNNCIRQIDGMEDFDYDAQKDTADPMVIKWADVIGQLMAICGVDKKAKIKANKWKPTLKEMVAEAMCLGKIKWYKSRG